jgi:hypothetical protein
MGDQPKDVLGDMFERDVDETAWKENFFQKTVQELKTEQRFLDYFRNYHPASVESFIHRYSNLKTQWYAMADNYKRWKKLREDQWLKAAFVALEQIQQKKLFDLQCLWRADRIKMESVEITSDFEFWQHNIFFCPDLDPIEHDEIDLYCKYLQDSDLGHPFDEWYDMQAYERIKENFEGKGDPWFYNPWYRYCDNPNGSGGFLRLPDVRGEKEEFYFNLKVAEYVRTHQQEIKERDEKYAKELPFLHAYTGAFMDNFVKENESADYYKLWKIWREREDKFEDMEKAIYAADCLKEIPLPYYPSEAGDDWQEGIKKTYERYRRELTIEMLPQAYAMYLENYKNSDWKYPGRPDDTTRPWKNISDMRKKSIIEGRVLNGEPADLKF